MTPIWNDEIERIKQDAQASVFFVSFATQNDAKSTLDKLSFARQITKDGRTGLALPGHIIFKVGKSDEGTLRVLLAGRLSTNESLEAYELFGMHGNEQMIVLPSQVESRITGLAAAPIELALAQEPAKVTPMQATPEIKAVEEPDEIIFKRIVPAPAQKPIEVASTQAPVAVTTTPVSAVAAPNKAPVQITPATEPIVAKAPHTPTEIEPEPFFVKVAQEPAKVTPVQQPVVVQPAPEPVVFKAAQAPAEIKLPPIVVKAAQAPTNGAPGQTPVQVRSVHEPAKVTPTPVSTTAPSQKDDRRTSPPTVPASRDEIATRIYLARQGKREGPFTLDYINAEIGAGRYKDDDFWAWHEGLPEWIPLYKIPGVGNSTSAKSVNA